MSKHLYILGAGISKDCDFPIVSDMLSLDYIEFLVHAFPANDGWCEAYRKEGRDYLLKEREFFSAYNKNIEDLFTHFSSTNEEKLKRLIEYMNSLLYLAKESQQYNPKKIGYLYDFVMLCCMNQYIDVGFITFNYDLLIERCIKWLENLVGYNFLNYHLDDSFLLTTQFSNSKVDFFGNDIRQPYNGRVPLLKLHGSLNWGQCSFCQRVTIHQKEVMEFLGSNEEIGLQCENCKKQSLTPFILPPSKEKEIIPLERLWHLAKEMIKKADTITIIGYSMPEYDEHAFKLITENSTRFDKKQKGITVINKFIDEKMREKCNRLSDNVIFIESGFKDYFQILMEEAKKKKAKKRPSK